MAEEKKELPQRKRLAALFASFAIVSVGGLSLIESMSIDYYTVLGTLGKVIPASVLLGGLGWVIGMILDKPKKQKGMSYNAMFLNEIAKSIPSEDADVETADIPDVTETESDND